MIVVAPQSSLCPSLHPPATGVAVAARAGARTVVQRAFASSPLRLLTPLNHGHAAWIFTSTYGGGLVGGDAVTLDVTVGADASAALLTQASTKIYRSPLGASMRLQATVGDGGLLAVLPDPVVPFAGSRYEQDQAIDLDGSGSLVLVDWMTAGRRACGERWRFDRYASRLTVHQYGRLRLLDSTLLDASEGDLPARMGRFETLCLVVLAGDRLTGAATSLLERCAAGPVAVRADLLRSAAPLPGGGCAVRLAATSVEAVAHGVRDLLAFLPPMLGDNPWLRKW